MSDEQPIEVELPRAVTVKCPTCKAEPGAACTNLPVHLLGPAPIRVVPHLQRDIMAWDILATEYRTR